MLEDQIARFKGPLSLSREIYSSSGCMCQISFIAVLTTAKASLSDVCTLESMTIILFSFVKNIKQWPSQQKRKQSEWVSLSLCSPGVY